MTTYICSVHRSDTSGHSFHCLRTSVMLSSPPQCRLSEQTILIIIIIKQYRNIPVYKHGSIDEFFVYRKQCYRQNIKHAELTKAVYSNKQRDMHALTLNRGNHWPGGPVNQKIHWPPKKPTGPPKTCNDPIMLSRREFMISRVKLHTFVH